MQKEENLSLILDEELKFCSEFENILNCKKEALIHRQIDKLEQFDEKISEFQNKLKDITKQREEINKMFGDKNQTLENIINNIENKSTAEKLREKQKKLQIAAKKIDLINQVTASLIEYSLKVLDGSVMAIAKALNPKTTNNDCYDIHGKTNSETRLNSIIVEDA